MRRGVERAHTQAGVGHAHLRGGGCTRLRGAGMLARGHTRFGGGGPHAYGEGAHLGGGGAHGGGGHVRGWGGRACQY
jgi:hypothetical protein